MAQALAERLRLPVAYAMRYGEPAIAPTLARLDDPLVVPLYPQYAESTTGSVLATLPHIPAVRQFHDHPAYIGALTANVRRHWARHGRAPMLLISFHGLPKRGAGDYEQQCRATAHLLEVINGHWRGTIRSHCVVDCADHQVSGASVAPRLY